MNMPPERERRYGQSTIVIAPLERKETAKYSRTT
jgi:hypothetical protein